MNENIVEQQNYSQYKFYKTNLNLITINLPLESKKSIHYIWFSLCSSNMPNELFLLTDIFCWECTQIPISTRKTPANPWNHCSNKISMTSIMATLLKIEVYPLFHDSLKIRSAYFSFFLFYSTYWSLSNILCDLIFYYIYCVCLLSHHPTRLHILWWQESFSDLFYLKHLEVFLFSVSAQ